MPISGKKIVKPVKRVDNLLSHIGLIIYLGVWSKRSAFYIYKIHHENISNSNVFVIVCYDESKYSTHAIIVLFYRT